MNKILPTYPRILAIAPSSFGFGLAVVEGVNTLVAWEVKRVRRDKNNGCMKKIDKAITLYDPHVLVLENTSIEVKRSARIRALARRIMALTRKRSIKVVVLTRKTVRATFLPEGAGSKDAFAKRVADRFPDELTMHLPPARGIWDSEDRRIAMFEAVALTAAFRRQKS